MLPTAMHTNVAATQIKASTTITVSLYPFVCFTFTLGSSIFQMTFLSWANKKAVAANCCHGRFSVTKKPPSPISRGQECSHNQACLLTYAYRGCFPLASELCLPSFPVTDFRQRASASAHTAAVPSKILTWFTIIPMTCINHEVA